MKLCARCVQVRQKSDGAQCFHVEDGKGGYSYQWLCGIDRSHGVKVGDKGTMEWISTPMRGYYRFTKDKAREGKE